MKLREVQVKAEMNRQRAATDYLKHEGSSLAVAPEALDCTDEQLGPSGFAPTVQSETQIRGENWNMPFSMSVCSVDGQIWAISLQPDVGSFRDY